MTDLETMDADALAAFLYEQLHAERAKVKRLREALEQCRGNVGGPVELVIEYALKDTADA